MTKDDDGLFGEVPKETPIEVIGIERGEKPLPKGVKLRGDEQLTPTSAHAQQPVQVVQSAVAVKKKKAKVVEALALDHDALRAEARENVLKKKQAKEEARLLKEYEAEIEAEINDDPNEEDREVVIDLPGHTDHIRINTTYYRHGHCYVVKASVFDYLVHQMQRCWEHEDEIGGANREAYQKPRSPIVNGRRGTVTGAAGLNL